jgi:hypothetical protein
MPARAKPRLHYTVSERGREVFSCPIRCERCMGRTADGSRCARRACIGTPFCWVHARQLVGVRVRDFPSMGKGLVAAHPGSRRRGAPVPDPRQPVFRRGDFIMPYLGEVLTDAEFRRRYETGVDDSVAEYVIQDSTGRHVDGACRRTLPALVNTVLSKRTRRADDIPPLGTTPVAYLTSVAAGTNARFEEKPHAEVWHGIQVPAHSAWIVATKPIREGDQILAHYGASYRVYVTPGYQRGVTVRTTRKSKAQPKKQTR